MNDTLTAYLLALGIGTALGLLVSIFLLAVGAF